MKLVHLIEITFMSLFKLLFRRVNIKKKITNFLLVCAKEQGLLDLNEPNLAKFCCTLLTPDLRAVP
jgi:hypothetical protein